MISVDIHLYLCMYIHSILSDMDPQDAGTSLNRAAFKIKSLELGVVIGVAMTCCCVFYTFPYLRTFPTYGHPLVPRCPDKRGFSVYIYVYICMYIYIYI